MHYLITITIQDRQKQTEIQLYIYCKHCLQQIAIDGMLVSAFNWDWFRADTYNKSDTAYC